MPQILGDTSYCCQNPKSYISHLRIKKINSIICAQDLETALENDKVSKGQNQVSKEIRWIKNKIAYPPVSPSEQFLNIPIKLGIYRNLMHGK